MINLQEIKNTAIELENGETTFASCDKLASLYIILDHFKEKKEEVKSNPVIQEYSDILPSYQSYCNVKRRYEFNEVTQEAVEIAIKNVCREIKEFLVVLYGNTDTQVERNEITTMLRNLNF